MSRYRGLIVDALDVMSVGSFDDFLDDVKTKPEDGSVKREDFFDGGSSDLSGIDLGNYDQEMGIEEDFARL